MNTRMMTAILTMTIFARVLPAQDIARPAEPSRPTVQPEALSMLATVERILAPDEYRMVLELETTTAGGDERRMTMEVFYRRGTGSLMELLAPARSKGIRLLERDQGLWMFNPRSGGGRAVGLSPREAFQGTVFSNSDLGDSRFTADYDPVLVGVEAYEHPDLGGIQVYRLSAAARSPASAYGRVEFLVSIRDSIPLRIDYYAKSGLLFKTMRLERIRHLAGRLRPNLMIMESRIESGSRTTVAIVEMDLRHNPPELFSLENLVRR